MLTRGKGDAEKAFDLLAHLDGTAFEFYFGRFTVGGAITKMEKNYAEVKNAFLEKKFAIRVEPHDAIHEATHENLDEKDLLGSLERLDSLYARAGFNSEAKYGFLRMAVTKVTPLATFVIYRGIGTYEQLTLAVKDYVHGMSCGGAYLRRCQPCDLT